MQQNLVMTLRTLLSLIPKVLLLDFQSHYSPLLEIFQHAARQVSVDFFLELLTWDQALFLFRFFEDSFVNHLSVKLISSIKIIIIYLFYLFNILACKAKRKGSLIQAFYEMSAAHFFDWLTCQISQTKLLLLHASFSMRIFHTWEKCGYSLYLIFN